MADLLSYNLADCLEQILRSQECLIDWTLSAVIERSLGEEEERPGLECGGGQEWQDLQVFS